MNSDNTDHTYWYEQDMYGNTWRIDYWTTYNSDEYYSDQYWKKSNHKFKQTLDYIKSLPETKKD